MFTVSFDCSDNWELCCHEQVIKSQSGAVQRTFPSHSKAVMSLVTRAKFTATTSEDFDIHLYQTSALMKSCEGSVYVTYSFSRSDLSRMDNNSVVVSILTHLATSGGRYIDVRTNTEDAKHAFVT